MAIISKDATSACKDYYIEYAQYVYQTRALPSILDGMKHVQRRIMVQGAGLPRNKLTKSSRIVGNTVPYHPHAPESIYGSLVSMTTPMNNFKQFQGKGNFGGMGFGAAAMRYTEAFLTEHARFGYTQFLKYADYEIGESGLEEVVALPALLPYCNLVGSSGIGVGMTTNILPLNLMELIDYYIATIQGKKAKIPKPDLGGGLMLDMSDKDIADQVADIDSKLVVRSVIKQESDTTLVLEALFNRSLDNVLDKVSHWLDTYKVDFRDESDTKIRYVFEIMDNSVSLQELSGILEKSTTSRCSFCRLLVDGPKAVYSSLKYQTEVSLAYLNKVLDNKFASEVIDLQRTEQVLLAIEYIKSSGLVNRLTQLTTDEYVNDIVKNGGFSLEIAKIAVSKPTTYLTKSHIQELANIRSELQAIQNLDRTEYLVNLYKEYKKLLKPLYDSYDHTVSRSQLLAKPKVSVANNSLVVSGKGKDFSERVVLVTSDGYVSPRRVHATVNCTISLDIPNVMDVETDSQAYIVMITNREGLLVVEFNAIKYNKQVIRLDDGEYVDKILPINADGKFEYGGMEYDPVAYLRTKISRPSRGWIL